jgi:hypothetical protein
MEAQIRMAGEPDSVASALFGLVETAAWAADAAAADDGRGL